MSDAQERKKSYLIDMDGVLIRGTEIIPGACEFIERLKVGGFEFLLLTNNPIYTPGDLSHRLSVIGLDVPEDRIFTSAMATARFLKSQRERGTVYVVGESGLTTAIHQIGFIITDYKPDYVVLGETLSYSFDAITRAIRFVAAGSHFIATNPDPNGPSESGLVPACGAMAALIESASGRSPFFVGKPNPLMIRTALNYLGVHSEDAVMIGDRMDTDIIAGLQAGMDTILVLSGVTARDAIDRFPYRPTWVLGSVAEIEV